MNDIRRPPREVVEALGKIGVDTVTSTLDSLGVRRNFMEGPVARVPGSKIAGPALTLRFLPMREDLLGGYEIPGEEKGSSTVEGEEEGEKRSALWEVFDYVQEGDVIVVDGRGDLTTGVFGEMLMTYFKAQGGAGVVIDAAIRDSAPIFNELGVPVWSAGVTTGGAGHLNMFPADVNLPVACGKVRVHPGDVIMADDGGAIVVPPRLIPKILEIGGTRDEKEVFVRMKLRQGGALSRYYPLDEVGQREYEEWLAAGGVVEDGEETSAG